MLHFLILVILTNMNYDFQGAARYFDPQDNGLLSCSWCGEDDHIAANCSYREKKRQKVCCICGCLGHLMKQCKKV